MVDRRYTWHARRESIYTILLTSKMARVKEARNYVSMDENGIPGKIGLIRQIRQYSGDTRV